MSIYRIPELGGRELIIYNLSNTQEHKSLFMTTLTGQVGSTALYCGLMLDENTFPMEPKLHTFSEILFPVHLH